MISKINKNKIFIVSVQDTEGKTMREFRKAKGFSLNELSKKTGLSSDCLVSIENNERKPTKNEKALLFKAFADPSGNRVIYDESSEIWKPAIEKLIGICRYP